jgi:hypothetical protein
VHAYLVSSYLVTCPPHHSHLEFSIVPILNLIARKYKMTISSTKTKLMTMWGNHVQGVKIAINDNIIEQVTDIKYLG